MGFEMREVVGVGGQVGGGVRVRVCVRVRVQSALKYTQDGSCLYLPERFAGCHMEVLHRWAVLYPENKYCCHCEEV